MLVYSCKQRDKRAYIAIFWCITSWNEMELWCLQTSLFFFHTLWIFIFTRWSWIDATTRHFKNRRTQNCYLKSSTVKWDVVWNELLCGSSCLQLSPALRNRFTEIWCPQSNGRDDLIQIVKHNLHPGLSLTGMKRQGRYFLCVGLQTLLRKKKRFTAVKPLRIYTDVYLLLKVHFSLGTVTKSYGLCASFIAYVLRPARSEIKTVFI